MTRTILVTLYLVGCAGAAEAQTFEETAAYIFFGMEDGVEGFQRVKNDSRFIFVQNEWKMRTTFFLSAPCLIKIKNERILKKSYELMFTRSVNFDKLTNVSVTDQPKVVKLTGTTSTYCIRGFACEQANWSGWLTQGQVNPERLAKAFTYAKQTFCQPRAF